MAEADPSPAPEAAPPSVEDAPPSPAPLPSAPTPEPQRRGFLHRLSTGFNRIGIRTKLVLIFVVIKVMPLLFMAWLAWGQAEELGRQVMESSETASRFVNSVVDEVGRMAVADATKALDERSRESIERLTTDTAREMARFLYARDSDVLMASSLPPDTESYRRFVQTMAVMAPVDPQYQLNAEKTAWEEAGKTATEDPLVTSTVPDSQTEFHSRRADLEKKERRPLYAEMTFVDLQGQEKVKVTSSEMMSPELRDISKKENTFVKAESYFDDLRGLQPGQIYVSRVIGAYVGSSVIGPFTPTAADKAGVPFAPEQSAFAGRENPNGKRFNGIVRWATPVVQNGTVVGYVTLALYHRHLMDFTDQLVPTGDRYTSMKDASLGNYTMAYDFEGRNIAHPREYTIVGYDPQTGDLVPPWMTEQMYAEWKASGLPIADYLAFAPPYRDPSLKYKPAKAQVADQQLAVYCPYTDFAPQCAGWHDLTANGGSGSFLLYWSGLWKLSTVATIPYYTGQYGQTARGFGWISLTANVDEFHAAATASKERISQFQSEQRALMDRQHRNTLAGIQANLKDSYINVAAITAGMILAVIWIAIWIASKLSHRIDMMITGLHLFESGNRAQRLPVWEDELGQVSRSFNRMADQVDTTLTNLETRNQELQKIAYAASHDFVEPLRSVISFSQMVQRRYRDVLDETGNDYMGFVVKSGLRMRRLVEGLQSYVHVLTEPPTETIVDSNLCLANVSRAMAGRLKEIGGVIETAPLPKVLANPQSLEKIFDELIDNAMTARREDAPLVIAVAAQRDGQYWHFTVSDTGKGIEAEYLERIFVLFQKLAPRDDGMATGMGLSLCQKLIEAHGGRIWAESTVGEGTTFHFLLPDPELPPKA